MRAKIQKISRYAPSIFQGKLEFSSRSDFRQQISLTIEHPMERSIFRTLFCVLGLVVSAYVYLVGATIVNVIARKDALSQTASLTSAVSALEQEYFAASENINAQDGQRLGLMPVSNTAYVRRPGNAAMAVPAPDTLKRNEI